jgi:hypothetical protein
MAFDLGSFFGGFATQATKTIVDKETDERDFGVRKRIAEFNATQQERMAIATENRKIKRDTQKLVDSYSSFGFTEAQQIKAAKAGERGLEATYTHLELNPDYTAQQLWNIVDKTGVSPEDVVKSMRFQFPKTPEEYDDPTQMYDKFQVKLIEAQRALENTNNPETKTKYRKQIKEYEDTLTAIADITPEEGEPTADSEIRLMEKEARRIGGLSSSKFGVYDAENSAFNLDKMLYGISGFEYLTALNRTTELFKNRLSNLDLQTGATGDRYITTLNTLKENALSEIVSIADQSDKIQRYNEQDFNPETIDLPKNTVIEVIGVNPQTGNPIAEYIIWGNNYNESSKLDANGNFIGWTYSFSGAPT